MVPKTANPLNAEKLTNTINALRCSRQCSFGALWLRAGKLGISLIINGSVISMGNAITQRLCKPKYTTIRLVNNGHAPRPSSPPIKNSDNPAPWRRSVKLRTAASAVDEKSCCPIRKSAAAPATPPHSEPGPPMLRQRNRQSARQ